MARGTKNSLSNPTTTLSAAITAGVTTSVDVAATSEMPDDGSTFSVNIGEEAVDQEVIDCTFNGSTLTFATLPTKSHDSGASVNIVWSKADYDNFLRRDYDTDLAAIEGLTPGSGNVLAADGAGWISKTYSSLKTALGLNNVTNDAQLPLAGGTMVGELDFDSVSGGLMNLRNGGVILDDDYPNFYLGYGFLAVDQLGVLRADARQIIRPMDFVGVSKAITLYGAHDATQTTVTMNVGGSGTNIQNAFTNLFFPKTFVIREGQADEEHIVCPSPPTNVASNRWQFTNVMRGYPLAGGTGQAHAASASTREVDNQYRMNGWAIPVYNHEGNYTQIAYHGQSDTSDTANPIKVFLPPRIAVGTWSPPSYITGENLSVFFVMRESSTDHHVEIWEPYDNKKVIDFPLGKQARYAEIMHHAQTGTYIYHSIIGGDVA